MTTTPLRYTTEDMDSMIRVVGKHRSNLIKQGHIDHFGQPVRPQAPKGGEAAPEPVTHDAHCVKCRRKVTVQTKSVEKHPNGKTHIAVGHCPNCGTATHKFMNAVDGTQLASNLESTRAQTGGV